MTAAPSIQEIVEKDVRLRKSGSGMCGPCPLPGCSSKNDAFILRPDAGFFSCRRCGARGDVIDYVRVRHGIGYRAACEKLGIQPGERIARPDGAVTAPPPQDPSPLWRAAAESLVERARHALHAPSGREALRYLQGRGLSLGTIRAWGFGYSPGGWAAGLWVAAPAILIPWRIGGDLWQVQARLLNPQPNGARYLNVTWCDRGRAQATGQPHMYGADNLRGRTLGILVEGALDAALLWQAAGDLVGVATLGSCAAPLPPRAARYLLPLRHVLLAYDADEAGRRGAARLQNKFPSFHSVEVPTGNDIGEFFLAGGNLRQWVQGLLAERTEAAS